MSILDYYENQDWFQEPFDKIMAGEFMYIEGLKYIDTKAAMFVAYLDVEMGGGTVEFFPEDQGEECP